MSELPVEQKYLGATTGTDEPLTEAEQRQLEDLLSHPLIFPEVFKDWISELTRWQVTPGLPFSDVLRVDTLKGSLFTFPNVSPSYPAHLTYKPAGTMNIPGPCDAVIFFMGSSYNWAGDYGYLGLSVNNAAVDQGQAMEFRGEGGWRPYGGRAQYVTLPNESNSVRMMVMKDGSGDVDFQDLIAAVFRIFKTSTS